MGHKVTVYSVLSDYDYSEYCRKTGVILKDLDMRIPVNKAGKGHRYNLFDKLLWHSLHKIAEWPDIEYKYRVADVLADERDIDLLITVAVPHQIHWGAALAKKKHGYFPKCWIADCGDPYMFNPFCKPMSYFASEERKWGELTDFITIPTEQSIGAYYPEFRNKIRIIPQGFDFTKTPVAEYKKTGIPTFAYAGILYPGLRDPFEFLDYLSSLDQNFKFILYTGSNVPERYKDALGNKLEIRRGYSRKDVISDLGRMDFLINISNKGSSCQVPSKLIDYALAKRPVLQIETNFRQEESFMQFLSGDYSAQMSLPDIEQFDIRKVARQFLDLANGKL